MSRAATVTLTFVGDTSQLEAQYESFVRKVAQGVRVPFTGAAPGSTTSSTTTFATASAPGATPGGGGLASSPSDDAFQQAINQRAQAERVVAAANLQLAGAILRQSQSIDQSSVAVRSTTGGGGGGGVRPMRGGTWGPGAAFDRVLDDLAEQEGAGRQAPGEAARSGPIMGRVGRQMLYGLAGYAGAHALRAYGEMGIEERLAVGPRGQTDLRRQFAAQTGFADRIAMIPIAGAVADTILEWRSGLREGAAGTLQDADYLDRQTALRESSFDYRRRIGNRSAVLAGEGDFERSKRQAIINKNEAYQDARSRRNEMGAAGDAAGGNKLFTEASQWIEKEFELTMRDLTRGYAVSFARLRADIPTLAARAAGQDRAAGRMELQADINAEVGAETDPGRRAVLQQRGAARLNLYDANLSSNDEVRGGQIGFMTEAYQRQGAGDPTGALRASQLARRVREMGPPSDDPNRAALGRMLDAQDAAETRDFNNKNLYRTTSLEGAAAATGLAARGQNVAAQAANIYSRGTLAAREDKDAGRLGDAISQIAIASNELAALRMQYDRQGTGAEVGAGTLAAGGTQGNVQIEDMSKTIQSIDAMTTQLQALTQSLQSLLAESN